MLSRREKGIIVALFVGLIAFIINSILNDFELFTPGASTIALLLGAMCTFFISDLDTGGKWNIDNLMPIIIILLGFGLNLTLLTKPEIGILGLTVVLTAALVSFSVCYILGRFFGLDLATSIALGAGGAICGNSAVIAVAPSLKIKEEKVAMVLAVINILCFITFLSIPIISSYLGMSQTDAGIWAGGVVHAVPQTIAAGEAIGPEGMVIATAVKLSRVSLLILVVPICAFIGSRISQEQISENNKANLPYFVPGFIISAIFSTWFLPENVTSIFVVVGKYMLLPMMASVGFFINWDSIKASASSFLFIGFIATLTMILITFGLIQTL